MQNDLTDLQVNKLSWINITDITPRSATTPLKEEITIAIPSDISEGAQRAGWLKYKSPVQIVFYSYYQSNSAYSLVSMVIMFH